MERELKVSVVIPVYNVSKYLNRCVDSVLNQSLKEIEVILVNDCSPDVKDHEICERYTKVDSRVKYINLKKNLGPGAARNAGIQIAKGDFLGFVDGDDYIHKDMYQVMYERAVKEKIDFVQCNLNVFDAKGKAIPYTVDNNIKDRIVEDIDAKVKSYLHHSKAINFRVSPSPCNKITLRKLWTDNDIYFPEGVFHEDYIPVLKTLFYSDKSLFITKHFYYYAYNPKSTTKTFNDNRIPSTFLFLRQIKEFLQQKGIYQRYEKIYINYYFIHLLSILLPCAKHKKVKLFQKEVRNESIYRNHLIKRLKLYAVIFAYKVGILNLLKKLYKLVR